jgi:haloacetate dehalogenase
VGKEGLQSQFKATAACLDCPTLALWGENSEVVPGLFDVMQIWRGMARNVRGVWIPRCGHLPAEEQPEAVNRELLAFLQDRHG